MIDVSPLLLWSADEALELMPVDAADSPLARRLAVLVGEAQAAGRRSGVLCWLCDVARLLLAEIPPDSSRTLLVAAVTAAEAIAAREQIDDEPDVEMQTVLRDLTRLAEPVVPAELLAVDLAEWALALLDGTERTPLQAWGTATDVLAAISHSAGDASDPAIARCAVLAYELLFTAKRI